MPTRLVLAALIATAILSFAQIGSGQRRWQMYEREMQNPVDDPPDAWVEAEFAFARLRFRSDRDNYRYRHARWGTDANKCDRQFIVGLAPVDPRELPVGGTHCGYR